MENERETTIKFIKTTISDLKNWVTYYKTIVEDRNYPDRAHELYRSIRYIKKAKRNLKSLHRSISEYDNKMK